MAAGIKTGGRKKGSPNKRTVAAQTAAASAGLLPHEFLLAVSQGKITLPETVTKAGKSRVIRRKPTVFERIEAAKAAAPYFAPKLSNMVVTGKNGGPIETRAAEAMTDEQLERIARAGLDRAAAPAARA